MFSAGTPTASASSLCSSIRLKSPCTGITYCGRVRLSIIFSSSWYPWPEAWIGASRAVTTSQPMW